GSRRPQTTERQRIGSQIDSAMIFARADFVSVSGHHGRVHLNRLLSNASSPCSVVTELSVRSSRVNSRLGPRLAFTPRGPLKRIGLRSHIRLSGVLVKSCSITSS